jgi:hypothetical protein
VLVFIALARVSNLLGVSRAGETHSLEPINKASVSYLFRIKRRSLQSTIQERGSI